jgi:alkyl hydroperoxide reductase subunit AhpC
MPAYQAELEKFAGLDAQVVGISIDSVYSHIAWQRKEIGWMDYPLASDFYPHGDVAKKYDIFREKPPIPGINERAVFVVDKEGMIQFSKVYDLGQQPDNEEVFEVLRRLQGV